MNTEEYTDLTNKLLEAIANKESHCQFSFADNIEELCNIPKGLELLISDEYTTYLDHIVAIDLIGLGLFVAEKNENIIPLYTDERKQTWKSRRVVYTWDGLKLIRKRRGKIRSNTIIYQKYEWEIGGGPLAAKTKEGKPAGIYG